MNLTISVTDLDAFEYCLTSDQTVEEFVGRLRGKREETESMRMGRMFHEALEWGSRCRDWFGPDSPDNIELVTPYQRERKITSLPIDVGSGDTITLSGRVDALVRLGDHRVVVDYKTTANLNGIVERLINSWQWRAYLWILELDHFRYEIFQFRDYKIIDHFVYPMCAYPGMVDDLVGTVTRFYRLLAEEVAWGRIQFDEARGRVLQDLA